LALVKKGALAVTESKERADEAFCILNDFIGDLVTAVRASEYFNSPKFKAGASDKVHRLCNKMASSFLFVTLAKWIEFYDYYKVLIPEEIKGKCKQLRNELERRGVRKFRNEVVGHIWSDKHDRPLMPKEIEELGRAITNGDEMAFLKWINDPSQNRLGETIVGVSEAVRDLIKEKWGLSESDLLRSRE
jgi:hypothetical protein